MSLLKESERYFIVHMSETGHFGKSLLCAVFSLADFKNCQKVQIPFCIFMSLWRYLISKAQCTYLLKQGTYLRLNVNNNEC